MLSACSCLTEPGWPVLLFWSLEEPEPDAQALWADEVRSRIDEIETGTAELEDWEAVRHRLQAATRP